MVGAFESKVAIVIRYILPDVLGQHVFVLSCKFLTCKHKNMHVSMSFPYMYMYSGTSIRVILFKTRHHLQFALGWSQNSL